MDYTTISVDIGAHHSGNRACRQQLAEHLMAGTAALRCRGRSACVKAVRAAISSPFTPAAPHCLHVMHAVHASGTEQQAAGALDVAKPPFGAAADRCASRP